MEDETVLTIRLFAAICRGELEEVHVLTNRGADIRRRFEPQWLPTVLDLNTAAAVEAGAPDNPFPVEGLEPVHLACLCADLEITQYLHARGVSLHAAAAGGQRPLHFAACVGAEDVAVWLISQTVGTDEVNVTDAAGNTPLHLAVAAHSIDVVRLLATHAARIDARVVQCGSQPMHFACQLGHLDTVLVLHEEFGAALDVAMHNGLRPIHQACLCGHTLLTSYLYGTGARVRLAELTHEDRATLLRFMHMHDLLTFLSPQERDVSSL